MHEIDVKKILSDWQNSPSLTDIDVEKLTKEEREDLLKKLDNLEEFALKTRALFDE